MASQGISIQIVGDDKGVQHMLRAVDTAMNPVAIAAFLGAVVEPWIQKRAAQRFASEGDEVTGPWKPLEQTTQDIRVSQGYGAAHPINKRTGELEAFIVGTQGVSIVTGIGATLTYPSQTPLGELGNKVKVAQAGATQTGKRPTPPRPVLGLGPQDLSFVLLALTKHISTVARSAGVRSV